MKYYNDEGFHTQNYYWSEKDGESYFSVIMDTIKEYIPINHIGEEIDDNQ